MVSPILTVQTRMQSAIYAEKIAAIRHKVFFISLLALSVLIALDSLSALTLVSVSVVFGVTPLTTKTIFPYLKKVFNALVLDIFFLGIVNHFKPELISLFAASLLGIILHGFATFSWTLVKLFVPSEPYHQRHCIICR